MKKLKGLSELVKMSEKEMAKFGGGYGGTLTEVTYSTITTTNVSTGGNFKPDSQKDDIVTDRRWEGDK